MSVPWLAGEANNLFTNLLLWSDYDAAWPTNGPADVGGEFEVMKGTGLPAMNTLILLTSGVTVTIAHHALKEGHRQVLNLSLAATVALGFLFVGLQISEYMEAYQHMNLTLGSGIYGSTFFMLTGFHGLHVTLGAVMLLVVLLRCLEGAFLAGKSLRVRSGGLVLALRRRRLAGTLRLRLLALSAAQHRAAG
jgi:cytochrome c oxidase subunit 3